MKHILMLLAITIISVGLWANPVSPKFVSEIWFTAESHCMLEIYPQYIGTFELNKVIFFNGDTQAQLPADLQMPGNDSLLVVDATALMPALNYDPMGDTLQTKYRMEEGWDIDSDYCCWGEAIANDVNPPEVGQSIVMARGSGHDGLAFMWCKDEPPTPGIFAYSPQARATLRVRCINQNGNPVPNVPISHSNFYPFLGYTDTEGVLVDSVLAGRLDLRILHPETNQVLYQQSRWLEPHHETAVNLVITMTDNAEYVIPVASGTLFIAYPNPFDQSQTATLTLSYQGKAKLDRHSYVKIYNLKGQYITEFKMPPNGKTNWKPGSDISSGMYFVRLINGNRIQESLTLQVIK